MFQKSPQFPPIDETDSLLFLSRHLQLSSLHRGSFIDNRGKVSVASHGVVVRNREDFVPAAFRATALLGLLESAFPRGSGEREGGVRKEGVFLEELDELDGDLEGVLEGREGRQARATPCSRVYF